MVRGINPFDILSGKVVQNDVGTFYFKEAGVNVDKHGGPISDRLHRIGGPAITWWDNEEWWYEDGARYK